MRSKNRPLFPEPKIVTEEAQSMHGSFDFSEANEDGKTKYKDRTITVDFGFIERDPAVIRAKAHYIASWLNCGEKVLKFDDEYPVFYMARINNKIDFEKQIELTQQFTIQFKCRPFAISVNDSTLEQMEFGQNIAFGYGYKLDMQPQIYTLTGPTTLTIYNAGSFVKPQLILNTGTFTNITFICNGKTLSYNTSLTSGKELIIDCNEANVTLNGNDVNENANGDFFGLENGQNELIITGSNIDCTLTIQYNFLYL
jgi:predicted phage tail component-like protein